LVGGLKIFKTDLQKGMPYLTALANLDDFEKLAFRAYGIPMPRRADAQVGPYKPQTPNRISNSEVK